jgi:hypothetical protein
MIYNQLTYLAITLLLSGLLLLTVDTKIYAVNNMLREKKYAQLLGWVQISIFALLTLAQLLYL